MFVVVFIIRPSNKTGNLSIILPKFQKVIIAVSTASIVSGFILFSINTNYQFYKLFLTFWGNMILVSGIVSLVVYYNIISGGKVSAVLIKPKKLPKLANQIPIVFFSMITVTLILMILISKGFVAG